jgi:hypothetical protein
MSKDNLFASNLVGVDGMQASYWAGSVPRSEFQNVVDEHASRINALQGALLGVVTESGEVVRHGVMGTVMKLDLAAAFLFEKFGINPTEFEQWAAKKAAEVPEGPTATTPAPAAPAPEPEKKLVTLE